MKTIKVFIGLVLLFIVFSPGMVLTLPSLNPQEAVDRGISYGTDGSTHSCITSGHWTTLDLSDNCSRARSLFFSGQTSNRAIFIHSIIVYIIMKFIFHSSEPIKISVLFLLLSPGLILTLPALSASRCASKGVAENGHYCNKAIVETSACKMCQSITSSYSTDYWRVIIHSLIFALILYLSPKLIL